MKNPYEVLGVSPMDSKESIKAKFRKLCKQYHPDIAGTEYTERFREIQQAWELICKDSPSSKGFVWTHGSSVFEILRKEV